MPPHHLYPIDGVRLSIFREEYSGRLARGIGNRFKRKAAKTRVIQSETTLFV